ncbi:MAG TPA: PAS domain S-box protein [Phycisphaerae bacterium]|nr:PAS domain S-box protein [Phycisphaerae bacterium]
MSSKQQSVPTAEQVLAGLFDGSDSRAFVVDRRMRVVQGGSAAPQPPGDGQQPEGRSRPATCHRRWAGSDAPCAGCPVEQVLRTGRARTAEVYMAPEERWRRVSVFPIVSADGATIHALIIPSDITKRKRAEDALRHGEENERRLNERLRVLHQVSNELTKATSVDELCRRAVELGRERLGFDRLSVWLVADDGEYVNGMFGTDERGRLRDERGRRLAADDQMRKFLGRVRFDGFIKSADVDLHDDRSCVVGSGTSVRVPMWDGEKTVGFLGADNLLRGEAVSRQDCELLALYASSVGHLCLRKQVEQRLRDSEQKLELILRYTNDGISMTEYAPPTHGRRLVLCNDRYVAMAGRSREELMAADDLNAFVRASESHEQLERQHEARLRGEPTEGISWWVRPDGAENYFEWKAVPIRVEDKIYHVGVDRDITERRRAEAALRESEHRYRTLFEQAADSILLIDPHTGGLVDFNERAYQLLGYTRDEFARLIVSDLEGSDTVDQVRRHAAMLLREGEEVFETTHKTKSGEIRDVLVSARMLTIRGRQLIQAIFRDVTERKRVERELRSAERRYRHIVETVPVMLWSQDMVNDRILFVSSSCKAFLGYSPRQIYDDISLWLGALHPEDRDRLRAAVEAFRRQPGVLSGEYRMVHRNGKVLRILQSVTGEVDEDGALVRVHGVSVDITDRWYMERTTRLRLRISQASVSATSEGELIDRCIQAVCEELAASGVVFYHYDAPSNRLVIRSYSGDFDPGAAELIGSPEVTADAARVCARAAFERRMVFVPDAREEPLLAYARDKIDQWDMQGLAVIPLVADGRLLGVLEAVSRQRWDLGEPGVRMLESIGHELAVGLAGRRAQAAVAESQRLRTLGALAAGIAHDFNNMLVSILGGASYVKARVADDRHLFEAMERLEQGASRAAELVQRLLAFGQHRTEPDALVDLNDAARNALRLIEPGVPKGIRLAIHLESPLAAIRADVHQIEQMVIDLCLNACEAMPDGGRLDITTGSADVDERLTERCELHSGHLGRHVVLTVSDSGIGMDRQRLHRAFEPFHTTKPEGHGLGLSAVHGMVSAHRGAIEVITAPGEGTTFRIYLPVAEQAEA